MLFPSIPAPIQAQKSRGSPSPHGGRGAWGTGRTPAEGPGAPPSMQRHEQPPSLLRDRGGPACLGSPCILQPKGQRGSLGHEGNRASHALLVRFSNAESFLALSLV